MYGKARSFVAELIVLKPRTKSFGNRTENASKTTKTSIISTNQDQIEAFFFYKFNLSRDKR